VLGEGGVELAQAERVVVCAAYDSAALLSRAMKLHAVRGQVSWAHDALAAAPHPLNGHGHFLPNVEIEGRAAWLTGSTYGRGDMLRDERAEDHAANLARLEILAPALAGVLRPRFERGEVHAWTGVRCASSDRRPLVGEIAPGLCISTAMGSRGLTFAVLAAELLAARLHGEPLPIERKLADALDVARQLA
jgi:tRNA 5-methylaminomethyl-2-thiouridine biosynthesis bifunctional protein